VITGIIVALAEELSTLKTIPNSLWEPNLPRGKFVFLTDDILLIHSGAGAENARKAAELAVSKGATQLMSWGCAAALSPDLKMGDLVLAESLIASEKVVSTAQEKHTIFEKTGAIALDMESGAIANVATHYAMPFLVIRAIADPASMDLPNALENALNEKGEVAITRILKSLVLNPKEIPHLIQIGQYFQIAKKTLSNVATKLHDIIVQPQLS
jgi:adenosylhomocysteine nucleosidase